MNSIISFKNRLNLKKSNVLRAVPDSTSSTTKWRTLAIRLSYFGFKLTEKTNVSRLSVNNAIVVRRWPLSIISKIIKRGDSFRKWIFGTDIHFEVHTAEWARWPIDSMTRRAKIAILFHIHDKQKIHSRLNIFDNVFSLLAFIEKPAFGGLYRDWFLPFIGR